MRKSAIQIGVLVFAAAWASMYHGCSSSTLPPEDGSVLCATDDECDWGSYCEEGVCHEAETPCGDGGSCPSGFACRHGGCVPQASDGGDCSDAWDGADGEAGPAPDLVVIAPPLVGDPPVYQLNFGNVMVGETVERDIVIGNEGNAELQIIQLSFEMGEGAEDFSLLPEQVAALPLRVAPGAQTSITVRYRASDGLTDHAILDVISNDPDEALVKIHLLSEFKGVALAEVSKSSLNFGDVAVGQNSQPLDFLIINDGTGNAALKVEDVRLGILANPDFGLSLKDSGGGAVTVPLYINSKDFVSVEVIYHPQAREEDSDQVVVVTDDPSHQTLQVSLTGRGVLGDVSVTPSPVSMGRVRVGQHAEQVVRISNGGGAPFELTGVTLAGVSGEWSLSSADLDLANLPTSPYQLQPTQAVTVLLGFDPVDTGQEQGSLVIDNTSPEPQRSVALQAEGYIPAQLETEPSPAVLLFGDVQLDAGTGQREQKTMQVILRNVGGDDLVISSIQRATMTSPEFTFQPDQIAPIVAGSQAVLDVTFSPMDIGSENGSVLVDTSDPDISVDGVTGRLRIDMAANGTDPNIFISPAGTLDFGEVYVGRLMEQTVRLRNAGVGALRITDIFLSPGSSPDIDLAGLPQLPLVIANSSIEITFQVTYQPDVLGPDSGAVQIMSNDLGVNPLQGTILMIDGLGAGCPTGTIDCDGNPQNGCERPCVPTGLESCNGLDDDCDCQIDEDFDLQNDPNNCGFCARVCSYPYGVPGCVNGNCQMLRCLDGYADCNMSTADGCEINTTNNVNHCGACDHACSYDHAGASCLGSNCVMGSCDTGWRNCDGSSSNGCETDIFFDDQNCGSCGHRCLYQNGIGICSGGNCFLSACLTGYDDCNNNTVDGCEVNLLTDPDNCNMCNHECDDSVGTPVCENGVCGISSCNPGLAECIPGDPLCETNIWTDVNNCGGCGAACNLPHATPLCANGNCMVDSCQSGWGDCNDQDPDGCEVDVTSNVENCGWCGNRCWYYHAGAVCAGGLCAMGACDAGFYDVDGEESSGCECAEDSIASACDDAAISDLGTLANGATVQISGNLIPSGDVDWYTFTAPDDNNEDITNGRDLYNLRVRFTAAGNPLNQYAIFAYRNTNVSAGCAQRGSPVCASLDNDYQHYYYNRCDPSRPTNCRATTTGPGDCQCVSDTARYWIEVRRSGTNVSCDPYILEITFTR